MLTCDVSNNPSFVFNIRSCSIQEKFTTYTNGDEQVYNLIAALNLLPFSVHFKKASMATILSIKSVGEIPGARLQMDTLRSKDITFTLEDGQVFRFQ